MATYLAQMYKLEQVEEKQMSPGDMVIEFGEDAFATTGTTKEVNTRLTECIAAFVHPVDPTFATNTSGDFLYCDRVITSNAITVSRGASGKSGLKFSYIFVGRKHATVT